MTLPLRSLAVLAALTPFALGCTKNGSSEGSAASGGSAQAGESGEGEPGAGGASDGEQSEAGGDSASTGGGAGTQSKPTELCAPSGEWANCLAQDFSQIDIEGNPNWRVSTWSSDNRTHAMENVWVEDGLLHLQVNGGTTPGEQTTGAEIVSVRNDYLYGSFRMVAQGTPEPGTVLGWFYYLNDTSEIDIEVLSEFDERQTVHFTIHENIGPQTHQALDVGFAPSSDFHEYRFDWFEDRVDYYIDGVQIVSLTENIPSEPGAILLNHWTLSNPAWGGGPPVNDAIVKIRSLELYTNN